ncbi:hypothetical protein [Microbacterium sp. cx-59]|uniref:hypothetical protein n=1 Tax=Microbacterium sp. cx-59 TaxID=2891207 RepID=UPI001E49B9CF|nr:hypothetical protein [Microbacterium sp. cx-59]MCC4909084.1 hypothetical protein [Microbacterium sp. cx-59]
MSILTGGASSATADELSVDEQQRSWYLENGVSPDVADELIADFNAGDLPDSMTGVEPVSSVTDDKDGWITTRNEFPDGSISVSRLETPEAAAAAPGDVAARSVGSCTSTLGGSGFVNYYDCAVTGSNGAYLDVEFRADYTRVSNGAGIINRVASPYSYAIGGTATTPELRITRANGTVSNPARATATSQYSSAASSFTAVLTLNVTGSQAWSSQNF